MSLLVQNLEKFLEELKDRKVYRTAAAYAAFAFVVIQVADLVLPAFASSGTAYRMIVILVLLGFPVAIVLAWVFEWSSDGVRVTKASSGKRDRAACSRVSLELLIAALAIGAAIGASWYLAGSDTTMTGDMDRSIAVLPFGSIDADNFDSFGDGLHDDLLTRLSAIRGFTVIARSSVERYRGTDKASSEIAAELGVRWILEGSVQRAGDQVRVSARLVDPGPGVQAWADSYLYDFSAANLFAVQAEITHAIAEALRTEITPREAKSVAARPTENLAAFQSLVEARVLLEQREEPEMRRALSLFREATQADPDFALAWVGVATSLYELVDYGFDMPDNAVEQARIAAERALELSPENPEALVALGAIIHLQQNGLEAIRRLEDAIELRPSYAEAYSKVSWVAQILGRPTLAGDAAEKAVALDPLAVEPRVNLALMQLVQQEPQRALDILRPDNDLVQDWPTTRFYEGVVLYHLGRHEEAIDVLRDLTIAWAGQGPLATEALAHAASGDPQAAAAILVQLKNANAHEFLVGLVHASLGDREAAFVEFGSVENWAIDADWPILAMRYLFPDVLDGLRSDPRYDRMLREVDRAWGLVI